MPKCLIGKMMIGIGQKKPLIGDMIGQKKSINIIILNISNGAELV